MRVAIVTDIHANRQALEAVLEQIRAAESDAIWCLGDVVGYGADPDACTELVREHADICLAGNHDLGVIGTLSVEDFSEVARRAAEWTAGVITDETRRFLESLSPVDENQVVSLYHASPRDPVWEYVLSPLQAELAFEVQPQRISVVGHTHVALAFHRFDGESATGETRHEGDELDVNAGFWALLNPGRRRPAAVTATLVRRGSSWTLSGGQPPTGGPSTTSRAPPGRYVCSGDFLDKALATSG